MRIKYAVIYVSQICNSLISLTLRYSFLKTGKMIVIQKALLSLIAVNSKCSIFSLPQTILPQLNPYNKNFSSQPVIHIHRSTLYLYNINNNSHHHSRQVLNLTVNQALCYALHLHWYINPQHNSLRYLLFPSAYM